MPVLRLKVVELGKRISVDRYNYCLIRNQLGINKTRINNRESSIRAIMEAVVMVMVVEAILMVEAVHGMHRVLVMSVL